MGNRNYFILLILIFLININIFSKNVESIKILYSNIEYKKVAEYFYNDIILAFENSKKVILELGNDPASVKNNEVFIISKDKISYIN